MLSFNNLKIRVQVGAISVLALVAFLLIGGAVLLGLSSLKETEEQLETAAVNLKITEKTVDKETTFVTLTTMEPSSDMVVHFTVKKTQSLKIVSPLTLGEAVAVTGRVKSIAKDDKHNIIELDPVVVRYKDKLSPKRGVELLKEVDKTAK